MSQQQLSPRKYQDDCIAAVEEARARGLQRVLAALATGLGKTVIFSRLAARWIEQSPGRVLILAHRDELIEQAVKKLLLVAPHLDIGVVKADRDEHEHAVVVASIQTLARQPRRARFTKNFQLIVVDEAHHSEATTYREVLEDFGGFTEGGPFVLGVTATPERADGKSLGATWQEIVYRMMILDGIVQGYLCDLQALQVKIAADFNGLHTRHGDYITEEVEELLIDGGAPEHIAQALKQYAPDRKAIVFTPTIEVAHLCAAAINRVGIPAVAVDGTQDIEVRREYLKKFSNGTYRVVTNCAVLLEGYDEPSVDCIVCAAPTKSRVKYVQTIGRGTRKHPGKDNCLVLDVVGATDRYDLMQMATLFEDVAGKRLRESDTKPRTLTEAIREEQLELEEAGKPVNIIARAVQLFQGGRFAWIRTENGFMLPLGTSGEVEMYLDPVEKRWYVEHLRVHPADTNAPEIIVCVTEDAGYAQGMAEDYVRNLKNEDGRSAAILVDKEARWRRSEPSEKQIETLERWGIKIPEGCTKGQASEIIAQRIASFRRR